MNTRFDLLISIAPSEFYQLDLMNLENKKSLFESAIGKEHIKSDSESVRYVETATFKTTQSVPFVLYPGTKDEVAECVKIANAHGLKLYPVSCGKNWGYGTQVPAGDGTIVLNMSRMNRILDFDPKLAWVKIEPGVTQEQLVNFLANEGGGKLWLDTSASSPKASVLGNAMERGHGLTPYADRASHITNLEIVLGDGRCLNTGYGAFSQGKTLANLDRWGVGPSLDGLFTQSNLGIVTSLTLHLMAAPDHAEMAIITIDDDENFAKALDRICLLKLKGQIRSSPHFANVYQSLLRVMKYPWEATGGQVPLRRELAWKLATDFGIGHWNGVLGLYGSKGQIKSSKADIKAALGELTSRLYFFDKMTLQAGSVLPSQRIKDALRVFTQLTGGLGAVGIKRPYWRKKINPPEDLALVDLGKDLCGYFGATAVTPFIGQESLKLVRAMEDTANDYGYEANVGIIPTRERTLQHYISICYDREVPGEDDRVLTCGKVMNELLMKNGWIPHRLGVQSMDIMSQADNEYRKILKELKKTFDPNGVIAPGRYMVD